MGEIVKTGLISKVRNIFTGELDEKLTNATKENSILESKFRVLSQSLADFKKEISMNSHKNKEKFLLSSHASQMGLRKLEDTYQLRKSQIVQQVDTFKDTGTHTGLISLLLEDTLAPSPTKNNILTISTDDPKNTKVVAELAKLQKRIDFDSLGSSVGEEMITYGEYIMRMEIDKKKGVIRMQDDVDQSTCVPIYLENDIPAVFVNTDSFAHERTDDKVHFCLGSRKIRVESSIITDQNGDKKAFYARIGRPILWGVYDLIEALQTLDTLGIQTYIQKLKSAQMLGISVDPKTSVDDALELARQIEDTINNETTVFEESGIVGASNIHSQIGKFKVVPILGDKGVLSKNDPRFDDPISPEIADSLERRICNSIGIPYVFYGGQDQTKKSDNLKAYSRYNRKLLIIQDSIRHGILQIVYKHLDTLGISYDPQSIVVTFENSLLNVEELDKIEYLDITGSTLQNIVSSLQVMSDALNLEIDKTQLVEFLNSHLAIAGLSGVLKMKKETGEEKKIAPTSGKSSEILPKTPPEKPPAAPAVPEIEEPETPPPAGEEG